MKRRHFLRNAALTTAGTIGVPYILPTGRLFAATGSRIANHVVFVLFGGGIRQQESVYQQYLTNQNPALPTGNVMRNMLAGAKPNSSIIFEDWQPVLSSPLSAQGTLFKEVLYRTGPTGHFNGHTVAMTGQYTETGLNLNINPEHPTLFEYYRKHSDPAQSAMNAWWISEGLGPYPSLNYSRYPSYGASYGANYLRPASVFGNSGYTQLSSAQTYQPDDVSRISKIKQLLDNNFDKTADSLPGIQNSEADRERIKTFLLDTMDKAVSGTFDFATPGNDPNLLTGDLINISAAWQVLDEFAPELTVINTINLDVCHTDFSAYINFLHKADYGVGWLWDKIQSHPVLANDTIMICMPEHGRDMNPNNVRDANGLSAFDHSANRDIDPQNDNPRRLFAMIVGPPDKVVQDQSLGSPFNPVAESIDIVPTIGHILGFKDAIPGGLLPGRVLTEAFV